MPGEVNVIDVDGAITNGGAYATGGARTVVVAPMPGEAVQRLIGDVQDRGLLFFLRADAAVHASPQVRREVEVMVGRWRGVQGSWMSLRPRLRACRGLEISLLWIWIGWRKRCSWESPRTRWRALGVSSGSGSTSWPGSMPLPGGSNGEIGMRGITKGSAIEAVLDHLGMDRSVAIGIGDSWNDVEMFQVCGTGIAMGNAVPELRALADEVTTSVRADGVWNAFVRHGLVVG